MGRIFDLYPAPRCIEEYQGANSLIAWRTEMKGGVVAALSKLMAGTILPSASGILFSKPAINVR